MQKSAQEKLSITHDNIIEGKQLAQVVGCDNPKSNAGGWSSAIVMSILGASLWVGLNTAQSEWHRSLRELAFTFQVSLLLMLPGILLAHCARQNRRLRKLGFPKLLLDFWLPAVVGLVAFDGYVHAVTGRSSLFYLNLIIAKRAYRWVGSGGVDANVMLFVPMALTMLVSMLFARWLHSKFRQPARPLANLWLPGLALTTTVAWWPSLAALSIDGRGTVEPTTAWERPPVDAERKHSQAAPPDVVIVVFESLRADALQAAVMPFAFSLAGKGVVLEQHYAGSNSSLLGLYGLLHSRPAAHSEKDLKDNVPAGMLAAFKERGYETAFFCGGDPAGYEEMDRLLGPACFDRYRVKSHNDWHQGDLWALNELRDCLTGKEHKPTLAILFVMSTHFDYGGARSGPFVPAAEDWLLLIPWGAAGSGHDAVVNRYRNAVHRADSIVGRTLQPLLKTNTIVAITGDHGQALYDDGTVAHWSRLSEAQTRVPLVIAGPKIPAGRVNYPTMHADVAQLLLDGAVGSLSPPAARPVLLVQSNPGLDYEDWAVIDGHQRTAWRRRGATIVYRGLLDQYGQLTN